MVIDCPSYAHSGAGVKAVVLVRRFKKNAPASRDAAVLAEIVGARAVQAASRACPGTASGSTAPATTTRTWVYAAPTAAVAAAAPEDSTSTAAAVAACHIGRND